MIPNTLSSSATTTSPVPPATAPPQANIACNQCNKSCNESNLSFIFGIASLILEGRNIANEEQQQKGLLTNNHVDNVVDGEIPYNDRNHFKFNRANISESLKSPSYHQQHHHQLHQQHHRQNLYHNHHQTTTTSSKLNSLLQHLSANVSNPSSTFDTATTYLPSTYDVYPSKPFSMKLSKVSKEYSPFQDDGSSTNSKYSLHRFQWTDGLQSIEKISSTINNPKHGPHCDQFLRRIGLLKGENTDSEEHCCDMSFLNITCSLWRAYCVKIETIIGHGAPLCIEVYLGPVAHKILLEQWIIQVNDQSCSPSMTLLSLCSAIRSQLYFSQISAWSELIKKSDTSIDDTGRIIDGISNRTAGDLIETSLTSLFNSHETPNSSRNYRRNKTRTRSPRLNIFYAIKKYDSTASFLSKPNVHTFPSVNVTDNLSLTVHLKSLPRLSGGIPKVGQTFNTSHDSSGVQETLASISSPNATVVNFTASTMGSTITISSPNKTIQYENFNDVDRKKSDIVAPQMNSCDMTNIRKPFVNPTYDIMINLPKPIDVEKLKNSYNESSNGCSSTSQRTKLATKVAVESSVAAAAAATYATTSASTAADNQNVLDDKESVLSNDSTISHREKQLQKYRKRILKRDKKVRDCEKNGVGSGGLSSCDSSISYVEKVSIGTQTSLDYCMSCGGEKSLICVNCHSNKNSEESCSSEHDEIDFAQYSTLKILGAADNHQSQADLLLQSIQRTPRVASLKKKNTSKDKYFDLSNQKNNNHSFNNSEHLSSSISSCQVCKRQKTDHIFSKNSNNDCDSSDTGPTTTPAFPKSPKANDTSKDFDKHKLNKECIATVDDYEKSTNGILVTTAAADKAFSDSPNEKKKNPESDPFSNHCLYLKEEQFKTPTEEGNQIQSQQKAEVSSANTINNTTSNKEEPPLENMLSLRSSFNIDLRSSSGSSISSNTTPKAITDDTKNSGKILPRINLTEIFCKPSMTMTVADQTFPAPLKLNEKNFNDCCMYGTPCNNVPVQKSFSAPSIVNPLLLSPRANNVIPTFKQRSRHLSDRSERSSFGSDEQFSDEDFENNMSCSSPGYTKNKTRLFNTFQRLPMLGNLEENLLQKRLVPKMKAMGFKIILGASGGFCPTQLTIPATAYFYEFSDENMSTPYFCEVPLPKKGYTVPRVGTVQVTLLNPLGTVVRMFVVPYDLRDMPPWHCTFVRQRILAEANTTNESKAQPNGNSYNNNHIDSNHLNNSSSNNNNSNSLDQNQHSKANYNSNMSVNATTPSISNTVTAMTSKNSDENLGLFITSDQMKRLRYCVHLKFQTSKSGRLSLYKDIKLLISRRTDCDTAAAYAKGGLESHNDFIVYTCTPHNPVYSSRQEHPSKL